MLLFNFQSGKPEDVPDEDVTAAVASGTYGPRKGEMMPVRGPDGKALQILSDEAPEAFRNGYVFETSSAQQGRHDQAKYGEGLGNELLAGAAGYARGLIPFGLTDQAMTKSGMVNPETLAGLREYNPTASTFGELTGIGTGLGLIPGGSVLEGAGAGLRGISELGGLAEKGVGAALGEGVLARTLGKAVGGATEGSLYGVGQASSEEALGDPGFTAEKALATIGLSAVLGGGIGGLLEGGAAALGRAPELGAALGDHAAKYSPSIVRDLVNASKATGDAIEGLYKKITDSDPVKGLGNAFIKTSSAVSGGEEEVIRDFFAPGAEGKALRATAVAGEGPREDAARNIAGLLNETNDLSREIQEQAVGSLKEHEVAKMVPQGNEAEVVGAASDVLDMAGRTLDAMKAEPGIYGQQGAVKRATSMLREFKGRIAKAIESGEDVNAKVFSQLDEFKRKLGPFAKPNQVVMGSADQESALTFENLYFKLRDHLEAEQLYGKAAAMQKDVNAQWHNYLQTQDLYRNAFLTKVGQDKFRPRFAVDPGKIRGFIDSISKTRNDLSYDVLTKTARSQQDLIGSIGRYYELTPELQANIRKAAKNSADFHTALESIEGTVAKQNQLHELEKLGNNMGGMLGGGIGFAIGGIPGAMLGIGLNAVTKPGHAIRQLAALERMSVDVHEKIAGVVRQVFKAKAAAEPAVAVSRGASKRSAAIPLSIGILGNTRYGEERRKSREVGRKDAYQKRVTELAAIVGNPEMSMERVTRNLTAVTHVAPKTASAMAVKSLEAAQFLFSKAPKNPVAPSALSPLADKWQPSDAEIATWERYVAAAEDPLSVVGDIAHGGLTYEGVETVRTLYGQLAQEIDRQIYASTGALKTAIPYAKRVQLGIWFDAATDPSLEPDFIAAVQQAYVYADDGGGTPQRSSGSMGFAQNHQTEVERLLGKRA